MFVRYAASAGFGPAAHRVTVNGQPQGFVDYPPTAGWSGTELRTTSRLVSLVQGLNDIALAHATNHAELDFIDVRPNTHRFDAELATNSHVRLAPFNTCYVPDLVGGIDYADSYVDFSVDAPAAGVYILTAAYANGGSASATHTVKVNGAGAGTLSYLPTGGWFGGGWLTGANPSLVRRFASANVSLKAGLNSIQLGRALNYAELDYITITPVSGTTPAIPRLKITPAGGDSLLYWSTNSAGYIVRHSADLQGGVWSPLTNTVTVAGSNNQAVIALSSSNQFYRLFP
jgi:hypothetical protein